MLLFIGGSFSEPSLSNTESKSLINNEALVSSSPSQNLSNYYSFESPMMGTLFKLSLFAESETEAERLFRQSRRLLDSLNALWSPNVEESEVFKINQSLKNSTQALSASTYDLLKKSIYVSELTHGAFDITYAAVGHLYDYREAVRPDETDRHQALQRIGFRNLVFDDEALSISKTISEVRIDLGGIAKGESIDQVKQLLLANSISSAYISLGGDSYVIGEKIVRGQGSYPWMLGIKDPRNKEAVVARIPLQDIAISTSGDYERFFIDQGERVHHILSPVNGLPSSELMSVTVIGSESWKTDALSTSVFVLGAKSGLKLIESIPEYEVILIHRTGRIEASSGLVGK